MYITSMKNIFRLCRNGTAKKPHKLILYGWQCTNKTGQRNGMQVTLFFLTAQFPSEKNLRTFMQ